MEYPYVSTEPARFYTYEKDCVMLNTNNAFIKEYFILPQDTLEYVSIAQQLYDEIRMFATRSNNENDVSFFLAANVRARLCKDKLDAKKRYGKFYSCRIFDIYGRLKK